MAHGSLTIVRGCLAFVALIASACGVASAQPLVAAVLPTSRSVQVGAPATAFATIINTGATTATGCGIAPGIALPAEFHYQVTSAATNAPTGPPDTPASIGPGQSQTYSFAITPSAPIQPRDVPLVFDCANTPPAPSTAGINTLFLSADAAPVPDVIALAATGSNNGFVELDSGHLGAFALATSNVGAPGDVTVTADTGGAPIPVTFLLCQSQPDGSCQPTDRVNLTIGAHATPTFSVFVTAQGPFGTDPAVNRAFVRFRDGSGAIRGSTSVAIGPTTLAGTWHLSATGTATAGGDTEPFSLDLPAFAVTQSGTTLSGTVIAGDVRDILPLPICSLDCPAPGSCTLSCPGVSCAITCTPAVAFCGELMTLDGTVAGAALSITLQSSPSVTATCSGQASGSLFISETNVYTGTGTAAFHAVPTASGPFTGRTAQTCGATGDFEGAIDCGAFSSSGTFSLQVDAASAVPRAQVSPEPRPLGVVVRELARRLAP
jgi:hypothetical protein